MEKLPDEKTGAPIPRNGAHPQNHDNDLWDDKTNTAVEEFLINGREVVKNGSPDEIKAFANSMQTEAVYGKSLKITNKLILNHLNIL